jgi:hypothetical protein
MFDTRYLKHLATSAVMMLIAACGGSETASPVITAAPGWASPAVFVPKGQESVSLALENCVYIEDFNLPPQPLYQTSIRINSAGDISFVGSSSSTGTVKTFVDIKHVDASFSTWFVAGNASEPVYGLTVNQVGRINKIINFDGQNASYVRIYESNGLYLQNCQMIGTPTLQIGPSAARAAKYLGSESGVDTYDPYFIRDGRIEAGSAYFSLPDAGGGVFSGLIPPAQSSTHLRFNLSTGGLGVNTSSSAITATYATIDLTLPATSATGYGTYSEQLCRKDVFYDFKEARTIRLYRSAPDLSTQEITVAAYGNKFMPGYPYYTLCSAVFY